MLKLIRWTLVVPMAMVGWLVAFTGSLALYSVLQSYCPEQFLVSGACTWRWSLLAEDLLIITGASISAVLFVGLAVWTAPSHKPRVAVLTYLIGLAVATWAVSITGAVAAFAGAALFGLLTCWVVFRKRSRRTLADPYQRRLFV